MSVMAGEGPVLYLGKTRRPSGRSRHCHHHLHTPRDNQLPRYHPKYLKARPRGASRLRRLLSPYLGSDYLAGSGHHRCDDASVLSS